MGGKGTIACCGGFRGPFRKALGTWHLGAGEQRCETRANISSYFPSRPSPPSPTQTTLFSRAANLSLYFPMFVHIQGRQTSYRITEIVSPKKKITAVLTLHEDSKNQQAKLRAAHDTPFFVSTTWPPRVLCYGAHARGGAVGMPTRCSAQHIFKQ